jgi:RNA polymerase primary sigma factor
MKPPPRDGRSGPALSPLAIYLREVHDTPALSIEEERQLAQRIEAGDRDARDHLVRANLGLVIHIARSYSGKGLGLDDLIEEGNLGLIRAVEGFNPAMNTRFSTYASFWIKQAMRSALITTGKTIRIPVYVFDLTVKWHRATAALQEALGRPPTPEEVARSMNLSERKLHIIQQAIQSHTCSTQATQEGPDGPFEDSCMDSRVKAPVTKMEEEEEQHLLLSLLKKIRPLEATVLRLRFGLDGEGPKTLQDIGGLLGLTRERVRQIERAALDRLRAGLEEA